MKKVIGTAVALGMVLACSTAMAAGGCGGHGGGNGSERTLASREAPAVKQAPIFIYKDGGFVLNPDR